MRQAYHSRDGNACEQARKLAQSVYRRTFGLRFQPHASLTDRLRRLTVNIANALDEAREEDARLVIRACEGARRSVAEMRETCRTTAIAELQEELEAIGEKCAHVEDAFVRMVREMESEIGSNTNRS